MLTRTLLDLRKSALHLRAGEILVAIIDRLELTAADRTARLREQAQLSTKGDEPCANVQAFRNKRCAIDPSTKRFIPFPPPIAWGS